jgi:hypothetical protein
MVNESFSIHLNESYGMRVWEMEDIPPPNGVSFGQAHYNGQKNVENLIKIINKKVFMNNEQRFLSPLYSILESSLEQGVESEGLIQWDDRSYYTRTSWTSYSWKLPNEIQRRMVRIDITKIGDEDHFIRMQIPLKKIAKDGGDILLSPKVAAELNLKNGNRVNIKIRFCN